MARYLQDVASDDIADVDLGRSAWVVRGTELAIGGRPVLDDTLELATFCSGLGSCWAERRTSLNGTFGTVEACAL